MAEYDELGTAYRAFLQSVDSLAFYMKQRVPLGIRGVRYSARETVDRIERGEMADVPPEVLQQEIPALTRRLRRVDPLPIHLGAAGDRMNEMM